MQGSDSYPGTIREAMSDITNYICMVQPSRTNNSNNNQQQNKHQEMTFSQKTKCGKGRTLVKVMSVTKITMQMNALTHSKSKLSKMYKG